MTIRIVRNEAGNCLNFFGSSNPVYFNACLSAEVDANDSTLVNVINDIYTANSGEKEYEFYHIPYTEFVDANGDAFADAAAAAQYITDNGNVVAVTNVASQYRGVWDASTNTPDLTGLTPNNGDWFYVSIAGTYNTVDYSVNDVIKYSDDLSVWQHVPNETVRVDQLEQEVSEIVFSTESALFNTNPNVYADGDQGIADPNNLESGWYYKNETTGIGKINWYYVGNMNPESTMNLGTLGGMYAVIKVLATGVPYFSVYTQPTGGASDAASWYRSRLTYFTGGVLDAYIGQEVLLYWGEDPSQKFQTIPHIELPLDASSSLGPAGTDENILFGALSTSSNSPEGTYEFIAKTLGYKNSTHIREYQLDTNDPVAAVQSTDVQSNTQIDFTRDATNTSVILSHNGSHYGVNTIKAVAEADGTISINGIGDNGEPLVTSIQYDQITITGLGYTTISSAVNALNALFTVNPYGVGYEPTVILPVTGDITTTVNLQEGQTPVTGDPTHLYVTGADTSSGHGARAWTDQVINRAGEYFDVKITGGTGRFILGLVDTNNATYMAELTNDTGGGHNGLTWGNAFYDYGSYTAPWTTYGRDSASLGMSYGPGWSFSGNDPMMRYNQEVQDNLDNMDAVLFRVGLNDQGYIYVSYYDAGRTNAFIMTARTSKIAPAGDYALVVKLWSGNTTLVEAPTVRLLADVSDPPTSLGDENITIFGEGITGTLAAGITSSATDDADNDGFVTEQSINAVGEYFEFQWSAGANWNFGLFSENDNTVAAMAADTSSWSDSDYIFYGARAQDGGGIDNRYSEASLAFDSLNATVAGQYYGRVGFDSQGRPTVWQSSDGVTWAIRHRGRAAAPAGNYRFIAVAQNDGAVFDSLEQGTLSSAPSLAFRYIESPDGYYSYPLFATQEEADYYELTESGSDNGSHTHVYPDDPTFTTWYMPNTQFQMDYELTPEEDGNTTFQGSTITWTEIPSLTNADLAPSAFSGSDFSFSENASVNIQVAPQDASWTTTVSGLPDGLSFDGVTLIQGTTSYVPADETHTITVTRTNSYGSSTGTFDLTINDNASLGDFTGFTEFGGNLVQPNRIIRTHDALLQYDTVLSQGQQLTYSYSEIPPTIGILNATGETNLAAFDPETDSLDASGSSSNPGFNFAYRSQWELRYSTFGGYIGGNKERYYLEGWDDNTTQSGAEGDNFNIEFKLEYGNDGYIRLYRGGVLKLTSLNTFSGDQALTFFEASSSAADIYIPSNLSITNIGAGSTTPPAGFTDPVESGEMASTSLFGNGGSGAVLLTETLKVNHRYVIPRSWIEANVLPNISGGAASSSNDKQFLFGVAKSGANWASVDVTSFHANFRIEGTSSGNVSSLFINGQASGANVVVGSTTNAFYDYAIEWDGTDLHVIACNVNDINTQPGVSSGGSFSRVATYSNFVGQGFANQELSLAIAVRNDASVTLSTTGLQQIRIPFSPRTVLCGEASNGNGQYGIVDATYFDLGGQHAPGAISFSGITSLDAGQTYTFIYHPSMEADDFIEFRLASDSTTVYSTGITTFDNTTAGDPSYSGNQGYKGMTFAVPADAPPLRLYHYNEYQSGYYDAGRPIAIAGSTYTEDVTGITAEGPAANQTGTNLFDTNDHGWASIDEQLGAGERLVLDNAFMVDLVTAMPDNTYVAFGLKDTDWTDGSDFFQGFIAEFRLVVVRYSVSDVRLYVARNVNGIGVTSYVYYTNEGNISTFGVEAFIEITSSGNNIRGGITDNSVSDNANSTTYADWYANYKVQTGDQGYGLTSLDVMIQARDTITNGTNPGMDSADVDWTGLSEVSVPTPVNTNNTPWTKALDFSGSSERAQMVSSNTSNQPLAQASATTVSTIPAAGYTSGAVAARPWACATVFKIDGNSSNQHIWNQGEGAGDSDDNIYLRVDAAQNLYFGWGRTGSLNECRIATAISSAFWYGVYIAHDGRRLQSAGSTPGNLYGFFDIRLMSSHDGFASSTDVGTYNDWNQASSTTGGRMDRAITGPFTIGGRGANRNFHGKVASFVSTTLKINQLMPSVAEAETMITDPMKWIQDYKVGQTYRRTYTYADYADWQMASTSSVWYPALATQVWLMGDGSLDSYSNMIRNRVNPADQNYTKLNLISMVSSDIQTVSIPGLS